MYRRNLTVVFKPLKNNSVVLPDSYLKLLNNYNNGCLSMIYDNNIHYMSWAPYGSTTCDQEIGINSSVAKSIGLKEGMIVKCSLVQEVSVLDTVYVTATSQKDWQMLEVSSYRIQTTLLEQTRIVNNGQNLVVWINRAMSITLKIEKLTPPLPYGKLENDTELIVSPFNNNNNNSNNKKIIDNDKKYNGIISSKDVETISTQDLLMKSKTIGNISSSMYNGSNYNNTNSIKPSINNDTQSNYRNSILTKSPIISRAPVINNYNKNLNYKTIENYENLIQDIKSQNTKTFQFRCISNKWSDCDGQICDVYVTKHNLPELLDIEKIYTLKTINDQEYYVNVKLIGDTNNNYFPKNVYPTIELNTILMKRLNIKQLERVTLKPKQTVINFIEHIELNPSEKLTLTGYKNIEHLFKQYILDNTKLYPILLNQKQLFKLNENLFITITLYPETFKYCLIDSEILKECKINCVNQIIGTDGDNITNSDNNQNNNNNNSDDNNNFNGTYVKLDKFQYIINACTEQNIINLCLDDRNNLRKLGNIIIIGAQNSGKTVLCNNILENLSRKPYCSYYEIFHCARNKGRKPDSIQRELRVIFQKCMNYAPSILLLDNLDILTQHVAEHTQDGDYYNRVSDVMQQLIMEYTIDNPIIVIATISNKSHLNRRIYASRGKHLFQSIIKIPSLEKIDREQIIIELCKNCKIQQLNYNKFSNLTEGYNIGDLVQFIERAIFYTYRKDSKLPLLTNDILMESLKTTNNYCLKGISNNNNKLNNHDDDVDEKISGLENVSTVLEEVLMWPTKYPTIFNKSPLRNQAGVLLFGPPGTGKTYVISKILKKWHLRMISVKGPELLAKFIGQSEENVRNLFDRARSARPCVLFFDEFDSLAPRRGHDSTGVTDRVVNQLLTELDGVEGLQGVVVIAATSRPELLDPALLRSGRIDRLVECTLPNKVARLEIFQNISKSLHLSSTIDFNYFLDKTDNYTGADIQSILTSANMIAVKECIAKDNENIPEKIFITQDHLIEAFNNTRPSLSAQDIIKYKKIYARFTNKEKPSRDFVAKRATLA